MKALTGATTTPLKQAGSITACLLLGLLSHSPISADIRALDSETRVPNEYIVVLKDEITPVGSDMGMAKVQSFAASIETLYQAKVSRVFQNSLSGFVVHGSEKEIIELAKDKNIAFIEANQYVSTYETQFGATWGIDRIDSLSGLDSTYVYTSTGDGVSAYIIDTGIRTSHVEFTGRIGEGADFVGDGNGTNDCNGHGTHVAGTVGGTLYGVAKSVTLHAVRVLNCAGSGTYADVIDGIDWVAANAQLPAVANMSLGGGASDAVDASVAAASDAGIVFVVAAGNSYGANACGFSPARAQPAITVGSTTDSDARSGFSNTGPCLDIFAPGSSILSASSGSDTATATLSGTSMAAPHVAGAVALLLEQFPTESVEDITARILANAAEGVVSSPGSNSPNLFLYTSPDGSAPPPPDPFLPLGDKVTRDLSQAEDIGFESYGPLLYGCVAAVAGELIPGKYGTNLGACHTPVDGEEVPQYNYRYIVTDGMSWQPATNGFLPDGSVVFGGSEGSELYLCRAEIFDSVQPGNVTTDGSCLIPYGYAVNPVDSFEVLVAD
ncbi:MAG: DUF3421 domain-containing protein [Cellvibrionaceae bacterium]|nr:DUF3421 domain-containing protein [Cellvibrionaceae bacterium]